MTPVRYGVMIFPRGASVIIYKDGTVIVHHGSSDIGQGLHVKVNQVVAHTLGAVFDPPVPLSVDNVVCGDVDSRITPNATFTGGSTSSEGSCDAARKACLTLVDRLKPVLEEIIKDRKKAQQTDPVTWKDVVMAAALQGVDLLATGHTNPKYGYQNYGVCYSSVEVDAITGEVEILKSHMAYDCGQSLNPAVDIGQAEGAFVMGVGFFLREKVDFNENGKMLSDGTWKYKPPSFRDIPQVFTVDLLQKATHEKGILNSKASGEPPLVLATSVAMAVRRAVQEVRNEFEVKGDFDLPVPFTVDVIHKACGVPLFKR